MSTQEQERPAAYSKGQSKKRKWLTQRIFVVLAVFLIAIVLTTFWILSSLKIIPNSLATISSIIVTVFGAVFAFLQTLHLFFPADRHEPSQTPNSAISSLYVPATIPSRPQTTPLIVQLPLSSPLSSPDKPTHRGIVGLPPPTDPRTIQQREHLVKDIYTKLTQPGITALALTGIGGIGKSTLAALVYRYAEGQFQAGNGPFAGEPLWLRIDPAVTMADLIGNLFEAFGKPMPDLSSLSPQNQAVALFNLLNTVDKTRLVVLDQFENLLDWQTGHALPDRFGVGEWLDAINSQRSICRVLLTSRPFPQGIHAYPPTYMQEYQVEGLEDTEGIELLRKRHVKATEAELLTAVERCAGHALSLNLLASVLQKRNLTLTDLLKDPQYIQLWTGNIAHNLLDSIYMQQLDQVQRKLLVAFSTYREPVTSDAVQVIINETTKVSQVQVESTLDALLAQHLIQASGEGRFQLHAIVASYARGHFAEEDEQANQQTLLMAHAKAAQYYQQRAIKSSPPPVIRRQVSDIHDLIEAIWQYCQAEQQRDAFDLIERESIFDDLNRLGGNTILLELYQLLLPLDRWRQTHSEAALIYNCLGEVYRSLGQVEPARQFCERGLDICKETGDYRGEGFACNTLGRIYSDLGQKEEAIKYYGQALNLYQKIGDRQGEARAFNNLGAGYDDLGQVAEAQEHYQQALNIYQELGDRRGQARILTNLGAIYNTRMPSSAQKEQARKYAEEAVNVSREVRDRGREGWALSNLGRVYNATGKNEQALKCYEQALSILSGVGDRRGEGWTLNNLGRAYADLGEKEEALKYYEQALGFLREVGDRWSEGNTLNNLGWVYVDLGKIERAREFYIQALRVRNEVEDRQGKAKTLKNLGGICSRLGKHEEAMRYYREALTICKEIGDRGGVGLTLQGLGILHLKQCRYDVALACFLLTRNIFKEISSPYHDKEQELKDDLRTEVGGKQFAVLLTTVESKAYQIVENALGEGPE